MAYDLIDNVEEQSRRAILLPNADEELCLCPQQRLEETAIELALTLEDREFTNHPICEDHVAELWKGDNTKMWDTLKMGSSLRDLLEFGKMRDQITRVITALNSIDFILSPVVRFITAFSFLIAMVVMQHAVVFTDSSFTSVDAFTPSEVVFCATALGFLLGEIDEAQKAIFVNGRAGKYLSDGWNILDWAMHAVFVAYFVMRLEAIQGFVDKADKAAAEIATRDALRILSLNCILLWGAQAPSPANGCAVCMSLSDC